MPAPQSEITNWVVGLAPGAVFSLDDVQADCSADRNTISAALSRLTNGEDPYLARLVRGLYSRRLTGQRWPVPVEPEAALALPWIIAGDGAGFAPPSAINSLGWSTQVPPKTHIAVVGRAPTPPLRSVNYWQRSNAKRKKLNTTEVTFLEAVIGFDDYAELSWSQALGWTKARDRWDGISEEIRPSLLLDISKSEYYRGKKFMLRCEEIADLYV